MRQIIRACLVVTVLAAGLLPNPVSAQDAIGFVVYIKGTAQIERGPQVIKADVKTPLLKGDIVKTEKKSLVKILFNDDTILTVSEKSRFSVDQYLYDTERKQSQSLFKLIVGKLRVIVGKSALKITTDTAIAGARGTVFEIAYDAATNTTSLNVYEGSVELRNIKPGVKGMQIVNAGQGSSIRGSEPPKPPAPLPGGAQGNEVMLPGVEQPIAPVVVNEFVINNGRGSAPPVHQTPPGYTKSGLHVVFP
jgi:hypothetical protein